MPPRSKRAPPGLADPTRLSPVDAHDDELTVVIIETPKGSRNKYAYDPEEHIFGLKTVLPAGMAFPYDFGFVPSTMGGDGDPLDVLVLMDEAAFPGCKLTLGKRFEHEIEEFFVNYHRLSDEEYRILALKGPAAARRCIKQARKRVR
jgi:inorganic pyrophosphatase